MKWEWPVFRHALRGLRDMLRTERHARWHLLATAGVLVFAWGLEVSRGDWMALIGVMALVWLAEAFNTAVEHTCDAISTQPNEFIKRAKDVAAGAVLIAAITAVGIGALVFLPYLLGIIRPSA